MLPLQPNGMSEVKINGANELRDPENPLGHYKINYKKVHHSMPTRSLTSSDRAVAAEPYIGAKKFLPGPTSKLRKTPQAKVFLSK